MLTEEMYGKYPHRRYNPLNGNYVLVSPHRLLRPWQGKEEETVVAQKPEYDSKCYLCAGNVRANGENNPDYKDTFVFTNDFAAFMKETPEFESDNPLLKVESVAGTNRVICFSPKHNLTLAEMEKSEIKKVVDLWKSQSVELGKKYTWVQIFENKGKIMGSSNPHPHGQIWASSFIPNEVVSEDENQKQYLAKSGSVLLVDYAKLEIEKQERIVIENEHWVVVVPFWATWPFETLLLPKRHVQTLGDLSEKESSALAEILKNFLSKYDNLFKTSFPYTMGWHGAPSNGKNNSHWQLHAHFYPPLLRSATVKKFMVGYEMLSESQRDITAEQAAERLRKLSDIHFRINAINK